MTDHLVTRGKIEAILNAAEDVAAVKTEALRRVHGVDETWKVGEAPPAQDLNSRWRRAIAQNPASVLGALQRQHPPASVKLDDRTHGRGATWTLPDGEGTIVMKWIPPHA